MRWDKDPPEGAQNSGHSASALEAFSLKSVQKVALEGADALHQWGPRVFLLCPECRVWGMEAQQGGCLSGSFHSQDIWHSLHQMENCTWSVILASESWAFFLIHCIILVKSEVCFFPPKFRIWNPSQIWQVTPLFLYDSEAGISSSSLPVASSVGKLHKYSPALQLKFLTVAATTEFTL